MTDGPKSPNRVRWEGIATVAAITGITAIATAGVLSGYECTYTTFMVIGIAGLGGFMYKRYLGGPPKE